MSYAFVIVPTLIIILEQCFPAGERPRWPDYLNSFGILAISIGVSTVLGVAALAGGAGLLVGQAIGIDALSIDLGNVTVGIDWVDGIIQGVLAVLLVLLVHDAWLYWSHRCEHRFAALWAFHKVHHSEERMNIMTAGRDHFLQTIWRSFFSLLTVGLFVDMTFREAAITAGYAHGLLMLWSMFYHSNTRVELPWLDRILVTPQVHRIHHSSLAEHQDRNFADMFPLFDILGGTYFAPRRGEFPVTGLSSGEHHANVWRAEWAPFAAWWAMLARRET